MKKAYYLILCMLIVGLISCTKTEFEPTEFNPVFDANCSFSDGSNFSKAAGIGGYYMYTSGYTHDDKVVFASVLSIEDYPCVENCSASLGIELHGADGTLSLSDFDDFMFLNRVDRNMTYSIRALTDSSQVFNHEWYINQDGSTQPKLDINTNLLQDTMLEMNLVFSSSEKSIIKFNQEFQPLLEKSLNLKLDVSKNDGGIYVSVKGANIAHVLWEDANQSMNRKFGSSVKQNLVVTTFDNQQVNVLVNIVEAMGNFEFSEIGYAYDSEITPKSDFDSQKKVDIVYTDDDGIRYRSSAVSQYLPHKFRITNVQPYKANEKGQNTISCDVEFDCLVYNKTLQKTLYIKGGKAKFAFVTAL